MEPASPSPPLFIKGGDLCQFCQSIFIGKREEFVESDDADTMDEYPPHHPSVMSLKNSAERGCFLCGLAWTRLSPKAQKEWIEIDTRLVAQEPRRCLIHCYRLLPIRELCIIVFRSHTLTEVLNMNMDGGTGSATVIRYNDPGFVDQVKSVRQINKVYVNMRVRSDKIRIQLAAITEEEACTLTRPRHPSLQAYTGSTSSLALARQWLTQCLNHHESCGKSQKAAWIPTRLIHVGDSNQEPRLLDQTVIPPDARYITLSHCWGSLPALKLTAATLGSFKKSIPMETLPKTFHDAVLVARALNVDYLWVDSLCILQDSMDDWHSESSGMNNVYKNGICNIAAVESVDTSTGCFFGRDVTDLNPFVVKSAWENCENDFYTCEKPEDSWEVGVLQRPLYKRAWVLQERFLAPRMLHFARRQVFWECREHVASESCPLGMVASGGQRITGPDRRLRPVVSSLRAPVSGLPDSSDIYVVWQDLVEQYSGKGLTRITDRFVAISGIAKELKRMSDELRPDESQYLAGLWGTNIDLRDVHKQHPGFTAETAGEIGVLDGVVLSMPFTQLLWEPVAENGGKKVTEYRAPSWSWLSMDCQVKMMRSTIQREACSMVGLDSCTLFHAERDRYRMVGWGSLRLCGWLWKIKPSAIVRTTGREQFPFTEQIFVGQTRLRSFPRSSIRFDEPGDHNFDHFLLPITADNFRLNNHSTRLDSDGRTFTHLHGLLLKRIPMLTGSFTRVGVFRIEIGAFMPPSIDYLTSLMDRPPIAIRCLWAEVLSDIKVYLQETGDWKDIFRKDFGKYVESVIDLPRHGQGDPARFTFERRFIEIL